MAAPGILWLRRDLRIADNPALQAALEHGGPVIPLYIHAPREEAPWEPGAASRWWLHHSLTAVAIQLQQLGMTLQVRQGVSVDVLLQTAVEAGADGVYLNRLYEPQLADRDRQVMQQLSAAGLHCQSFVDGLLCEPASIVNRQGQPYRVFTPFFHACLARLQFAPTGRIDHCGELRSRPCATRPATGTTTDLHALRLLPRRAWDAGLAAAWTPGAAGAQLQLARLLDQVVAGYAEQRDRPDIDGTSRLSPHLHFGELSSWQIWSALQELVQKSSDPAVISGGQSFLRQIIWREFAYYILHHFPLSAAEPLDSRFTCFAWAEDNAALTAWQRGETGYPLVDAGMRQLWECGWMHNRVRMVVASFLTKHLLQPWQLGAAWFWDTLVDADLANNSFGWQWTAGCGADAAPYFRIFNPVLQGQKFDPHGDYVRRYVPELRRLPARWIHQPWRAPVAVLHQSGVTLGKNYPYPIVDHQAARRRALAAYAQCRLAAQAQP